MIKDFISLNITSMFKEIYKYILNHVFTNRFISKSKEKSIKSWFSGLILIFESFLKNALKLNLIISLLFPMISISQTEFHNNTNCNQEQHIKEFNYDLYKLFIKNKQQVKKVTIELPVVLHIIRKTNGKTNYNLSQLLSKIPHGFATINQYLTPLNTRLYLAKINYIDSDYLYNKKAQRIDYVSFLNPNSTNFFITNEGGNFSSFPNSSTTPNAIFFSRNIFGSSSKIINSTLPHEIGHYLGLMHTHTNTEYGNNFPLAENVARVGSQSNCKNSGDYLCSTAADSYNSNDTKDKYGIPYNPDIKNVMSYYRNSRESFTNEQLTIMESAISFRLNDNRYDIDGYIQQQELEAPKIISLENSSLYNTLRWTNIENNLGYIVERSNNSTNSIFTPIIGLSKNTNSFIDENIEKNTRYSYRVIPVNSPKNYSDVRNIRTENVYCNVNNTCDGFGFVPERIVLKSKNKKLINSTNINCNNKASVIDYSNSILESSSDIELKIDQSRKQDFLYNVFIDLNGDGEFNTNDEWIIKNDISTDKYSYSSIFNLNSRPLKQGKTSMRIISSFYKNTNETHPIEDPCNVNLGFTQDFIITLQDQRKEVFWIGNTSNDWFTTTNWSNNLIPDKNTNVTITEKSKNYPIINDKIEFNSLKIENGGVLISKVAIDGAVFYEKKLSNNSWNIFSSPVINQAIQKLINDNDLIINNEEELSLSYFNTTENSWNCFSNSTVDDLQIGRGYSIKLNESKTVTFNGEVAIKDISIPITKARYTNMNLIGNPFLAYINSLKFISINTKYLSEETIWIWNGKYYEAHNNMNPIELAPTDGFFIDIKKEGNALFKASDLHQNKKNQTKKSNVFQVELIMKNSNRQHSTKIFYSESKTTGFDNGFDSKIFSEETDFLIFSELVSKKENQKLAIQTLPDTNLNNIIIPIGFKTQTKEELNISAKLLNIPDNYEVFLEDREYNKFINLNGNSHSFSPKKNTIELGRFYIHTIEKEIIEADNTIKKTHIYKSNTNEITIKNLEFNGLLKIYSMQGQELLSTTIKPLDTNKIKFENRSSSIYLISLITKKGKIIKKIKF